MTSLSGHRVGHPVRARLKREESLTLSPSNNHSTTSFHLPKWSSQWSLEENQKQEPQHRGTSFSASKVLCILRTNAYNKNILNLFNWIVCLLWLLKWTLSSITKIMTNFKTTNNEDLVLIQPRMGSSSWNEKWYERESFSPYVVKLEFILTWTRCVGAIFIASVPKLTSSSKK